MSKCDVCQIKRFGSDYYVRVREEGRQYVWEWRRLLSDAWVRQDGETYASEREALRAANLCGDWRECDDTKLVRRLPGDVYVRVAGKRGAYSWQLADPVAGRWVSLDYREFTTQEEALRAARRADCARKADVRLIKRFGNGHYVRVWGRQWNYHWELGRMVDGPWYGLDQEVYHTKGRALWEARKTLMMAATVAAI